MRSTEGGIGGLQSRRGGIGGTTVITLLECTGYLPASVTLAKGLESLLVFFPQRPSPDEKKFVQIRKKQNFKHLKLEHCYSNHCG